VADFLPRALASGWYLVCQPDASQLSFLHAAVSGVAARGADQPLKPGGRAIILGASHFGPLKCFIPRYLNRLIVAAVRPEIIVRIGRPYRNARTGVARRLLAGAGAKALHDRPWRAWRAMR